MSIMGDIMENPQHAVKAFDLVRANFFSGEEWYSPGKQ